MMSYFWPAATMIWLWIYWSAAMLFRATVLALAIPVLAVYLIPDFLPRFGSSRSTFRTPAPHKHGTPARKLPILLHEKGGFFAIQPDGSKVEIDPLLFSEHFRQCSGALAAAMVYEKSRIRDTDFQ